MTPERWRQLKELFLVADALPQHEQTTFLKATCGNDSELLAEAFEMLDSSKGSPALLSGDLLPLAAKVLADEEDPYLGRVFGAYYFRARLGVGGMSWVYLAERPDYDGLVAVKVLQDIMSTERRQMFDYEKRILAQMNHPGIAHLFDAGELEDGAAFFAMEYVDGIPITDFCREQRLTLAERLSLFLQVCEAVRYAHDRGIIHRDLKPSNILVRADGTAKLLDFGVSERITQVREGSQSSSYMTLVYAAPEQIRHEAAEVQADIYSLGIILQQLLTGELPYEVSDKTTAEIRSIVLSQNPKLPSLVLRERGNAFGSEISSDASFDIAIDLNSIGRLDWEDLDHICAKAYAKNAAARYGSVESLTRQLDRFRQRKPLEGREKLPLYVGARFFQRHRKSSLITAVIVCFILGLVAFYTWRLTQARNAALAEAARTERVRGFMERLFTGDDANNGPSVDLRVVTILEHGVRDAKVLNTDPPIQAELYETLAGIYSAMENFPAAEPLFQAALKEQSTLYGEDSVQVADTLASLGVMRRSEGKAAEAEQTIRKALAIDRRKLPLDHPQTTEASISLGVILIDRGAYNDSIGILEKAVEVESGKNGSAYYLSSALSNLANAYFYVGQLDRSEKLNQRALEIDRKLKGDENIDIAEDLMSIATQNERLGHLAEAEEEERQVLAIERKWYRNEDHVTVAAAMTILSQTLGKEKKYEEALPLAENALAMRQRIHAPVSTGFAHAWNALGTINDRLGHLDEAEKDQTEALGMYQKLFPGQSFQAGVCLDNLAAYKFARKRYVEADRFSQEALAMLTAKLPADDVMIATAETHYGRSLAAQSRFQEAEREYLSAYTILTSRKESRLAEIAIVRAYLATLYDLKHEPAKASQYR